LPLLLVPHPKKVILLLFELLVENFGALRQLFI
jgi:hypothetical protein